MKHSILSILLILLASTFMSGCSLFSSDSEEGETATVAESEEGAEGAEGAEGKDEYAYDDFEDGDDEDSGDEGEDDDFADSDEPVQQNLEVGAQDVDVEESFGSDTDVDEYPDDDYENGGSAVADSGEFSQDSVFVDEGGGEIPEDAMSSNQEQDLFAREDTPVVDEPSFADATDYSDPGMPSWVPVKKMKDSSFKRAGVNANRLYVVRPGDDMSSIAQKTGSNTQDLYNVNPHFNGKTLKVGDKIYYGSSRSPNDASMKTYYEDMNIPPQYYTSQSGDNIRKVSKKLLGHNRSWMEVWATNASIESKDTIVGGLQLRYWPDGADTQMAKAEPTPVQNTEPEVQEVTEVEELPMEEVPVEEIPGGEEIAQLDDPGTFDEDMPEMSEEDEFNPPPAAGQAGSAPPPPKAMAPPPPPPPAPMANNNQAANPDAPMSFSGAKDALAAAKDDQMIMGALGGLLILAAIIMLIFIRRSRAKRVNFSQTQV